MFHFYNFHKFFAFFSNNFFVCPDFLCIKSLSQMYSLFTSSPGQEFGTAHTHTQFSFISSFSEKVFFREWFYISFFFLSFFSSSKCSFAVDTCRWCRIQCNFILHFSDVSVGSDVVYIRLSTYLLSFFAFFFLQNVEKKNENQIRYRRFWPYWYSLQFWRLLLEIVLFTFHYTICTHTNSSKLADAVRVW